MEYQGNEIYLEDGTYYAIPINADGTLDKANVTEATETPQVILDLALAESREDRADPLFVYHDDEEGAHTLSLFEYYGELPIAEGVGATFLEAAEALRDSIARVTSLL
jgi:beta-glucosidase-like glycosyl hydrolase